MYQYFAILKSNIFVLPSIGINRAFIVVQSVHVY